VETVYNEIGIKELAMKHGLPIIDLSRTFDVTNEKLYLFQMEPSYEGG